MIATALLATALNLATSCSKPVSAEFTESYITPGAVDDVAYGHGLTLDAYAPQGTPRPAAIIIHGSYGDKRTHVTQLFEPLERAGFSWFSVDYRSTEDVEEAIRFIRCPGRFDVTNTVFLIGEDTGGEIALELAARGGFQGVATFGVKFGSSFMESEPGQKPEIHPALPSVPVLMFHGTDDDESPIRRAQAMCKEMPNCIFHPVPGGIHEFENWHPDVWSWKMDLTAWLRGNRRGLWKDIVYTRPDGRDLLMDAYVPEGEGPFPAAIIIHGGGWEAGNKITYVSPLFEPLAQARFAWFSIDYRLTPFVRVDGQLDDVRSAIRFIRQHSEWFHVDPNRLALIGESAGAHLAVQVASEPCPDCRVQALVSFYGVYDLTQWMNNDEGKKMVTRIVGDTTRESALRYSPSEHISINLPPTLLIQGTKDELHPGTLEYAARLKKAGVPSELVLLEGAPHGMENWEGHPEWAFYKRKLVDWLRSVFERH